MPHTYALQQFCPRIAEGENHDGWLTLITGTYDEMKALQDRPYHNPSIKRQLRIVEVR